MLQHRWCAALSVRALVALLAAGALSAIGSASATAESYCAEPQFIQLSIVAVGQPFHFSEGLSCLPGSDPLSNAQIHWGDGSTSTGSLTVSGSEPEQATVSGEHVYSATGSFHIVVYVTDTRTGETLMRGWHTAVMVTTAPPSPPVPPPPVPSPPPGQPAPPGQHPEQPVRLRVGQPLARAGERVRLSLARASTALPISALRASISWGDGGHSSAALRGRSPELRVEGRHRWRRAGRYWFTVTITDRRGQTLARGRGRVLVRPGPRHS